MACTAAVAAPCTAKSRIVHGMANQMRMVGLSRKGYIAFKYTTQDHTDSIRKENNALADVNFYSGCEFLLNPAANTCYHIRAKHKSNLKIRQASGKRLFLYQQRIPGPHSLPRRHRPPLGLQRRRLHPAPRCWQLRAPPRRPPQCLPRLPRPRAMLAYCPRAPFNRRQSRP